ncbi:hypothetical protein NX776_00550 [Apilactobacillus kunkeei]|uniref:hypothetical protein n=1 Tax=Apilactobacillus kunkeei TaxID=148814 RepID=UPI0026585468|nr:hypothetical protein [Apilactobacillus kunkeei]MCX0325207.1 hypothetical protein [Apilactobacillus kunkeei]
MVEYRCPWCLNTFHDRLRFCPFCGREVRYSKNDLNFNNNTSRSTTFFEALQGLGDGFLTLGYGCGCGCLMLILFIFLIMIIL